MEEGDSQPVIKTESIEEQENIGDSANVSQEKSASSGSEGSDGFVKLDELEDAQPASPETVEDIPVQSDVQASEEFTKLTPSTDVSKGSLESLEGNWDDRVDTGYAAASADVESDKSLLELEDDEVMDDFLTSPDFKRETKMNVVEEEIQKSSENGLQEAEDDVAAVGDVVGSGDVPRTLNSVEDFLDVEKPAAMTNPEEDDAVEPCKLHTVLPTSIERGNSLSGVGTREPVTDLLYWRDVKASTVTFSLLMLTLLNLNHSSALLVYSYISLSLLTVTVAVKMYRFVMQTVNGTQQPNPFQDLMELDITISQERAQKYLNIFLSHFNCTVLCARDLFLVKNVTETLKFALFSWVMGYVGSVFNSLTLVIIAVALAFTAPVIYEKNQAQIDQYWGMGKQRLSLFVENVRSTVPGLKPKVE